MTSGNQGYFGGFGQATRNEHFEIAFHVGNNRIT